LSLVSSWPPCEFGTGATAQGLNKGGLSGALIAYTAAG